MLATQVRTPGFSSTLEAEITMPAVSAATGSTLQFSSGTGLLIVARYRLSTACRCRSQFGMPSVWLWLASAQHAGFYQPGAFTEPTAASAFSAAFLATSAARLNISLWEACTLQVRLARTGRSTWALARAGCLPACVETDCCIESAMLLALEKISEYLIYSLLNRLDCFHPDCQASQVDLKVTIVVLSLGK